MSLQDFFTLLGFGWILYASALGLGRLIAWIIHKVFPLDRSTK